MKVTNYCLSRTYNQFYSQCFARILSHFTLYIIHLFRWSRMGHLTEIKVPILSGAVILYSVSWKQSVSSCVKAHSLQIFFFSFSTLFSQEMFNGMIYYSPVFLITKLRIICFIFANIIANKHTVTKTLNLVLTG